MMKQSEIIIGIDFVKAQNQPFQNPQKSYNIHILLLGLDNKNTPNQWDLNSINTAI